MTAAILVTDGEQRAALAVVRSLGRAGHRVEVCSTGGASIAGASRYCATEHAAPDPLEAPGAFRDRLLEICRERGIRVMIPVSDPALLVALTLQEELPELVIPFPDSASHRAVSDKAEVMERAAALGIAVPTQCMLTRPPGPGEDVGAAHALPPFPLVVKPARSVVEVDGRRMKTRVAHAPTAAALVDAISGYPPAAYPLLLQQRVQGSGEGCFVLLWEGKLVASFAHRRIREKPPTGGVSVYREAVPLDPELREETVRLLNDFGWTGVAMVEYKRSARDGRPYLMEVNGRFWGSLQLAVDAGVDFPRLLVELALGGSPAPVREWRTGIRSRWWLGDLDHLLIRLRGDRDPEALPPGSGTRLGAALRFLLPWRPGDRSEVLRLRDPRPGLRELRQWGWSATGHDAAKSRRDDGARAPRPSSDARARADA